MSAPAASPRSLGFEEGSGKWDRARPGRISWGDYKSRIDVGEGSLLSPGGEEAEEPVRLGAVVGIAGVDRPRAVLLAVFVVAAIGLTDRAALRLNAVRRPARPEVRAAEQDGVRAQIAVGVDEDGTAEPLRARAARAAPRQGGGGEREAAGELQLAPALHSCRLHGNESQARVDREGRDEVAATLLGAVDAHGRLALR